MHRWIFVTLALALLSCNAAPAQTVSAPAPASPKPEDWTTLSLEKSNLPLSRDRGPVISRIEAPEYTRELIRLQWRPADPIDLYVVLPKGVKNPPVIVYLYDFTSDPARFRDDGWCKRMTKNGFAAVGLLTAVSGDRLRSPRPMKEWFVSELQEALASSAHDVGMVLNYLATRGDLDVKSVGIFGQGSGGAVAILAAAADPRITAVDVMDPWGDWPEWLKTSQQVPDEERPLYLTPEFLHKVAGLDPVALLPQLKQRSVRVQQVLDDTTTPQGARDKIAAAVPRQDEVVRYKDWAALQEAYKSTGLSAWLQAQLRPVTPEAPERSSR
jgi:hypothetical protein